MVRFSFADDQATFVSQTMRISAVIPVIPLICDSCCCFCRSFWPGRHTRSLHQAIYEGVAWVSVGFSPTGDMIVSDAVIGLPDDGTALEYDLTAYVSKLGVTPPPRGTLLYFAWRESMWVG